MSKITCKKCGEKIKVKSLFLEQVGCENCGNRIDFSTMDELSGLRQGLLLGAAVVIGVVLFLVMLNFKVTLDQIPALLAGMSAHVAVLVLMGALLLVIIVGELEKKIGCLIYEKARKREEELEKIAELKRAEDEKNKDVQ